jgi:DNA-binding NarL/FixJ family response regulator
MIRILVADDHAILRAAVSMLLERQGDMTVVGEAASADQTVARARGLQPDVVLLDAFMPRKSGFDALPELHEVAPAARVIMLSMQTHPSAIRQALTAGASGYIAKHASETTLLEGVRRVAAGSRYVDPDLGADLVVSDADALADPISPRERDVLYLLALGYTNQEIAAMLFISVRTVDTHRAHIMRKLNLATRSQLVLYALSTGLIGPSSSSPSAESRVARPV